MNLDDILGGIGKDVGSALNNVGQLASSQNKFTGFVNPFTYNPNGTAASGGTATGVSTGAGSTNYGALAGQQSSEYNNLLYSMSQLRPGQIVGGGLQEVNNAWNSAYSAAQQQGSQWYNSMIGQLQQNVGAEETAQQNLAQNSLQGIQENLGNVLAQNQLTGQRTQQDTSTTLANMANAQQNQLAQTGLASDTATRAMQGQQGASGTVESGIGQGQQAIAQQQAGLQSQQEQQGYNIQTQAQNLFQNRTMQDLATGSDIAQQQANLQSQATNFSLQSYITQMTAQSNSQAEAYGVQEQGMIQQGASNLYKTGISNYLGGLQGKVAPQDFATTASALLGAY